MIKETSTSRGALFVSAFIVYRNLWGRGWGGSNRQEVGNIISRIFKKHLDKCTLMAYNRSNKRRTDRPPGRKAIGMKTIFLYRNAVRVRRVLCSKKGFVEYIEKEVANFGPHRFYALFTHSRTLIGTCGYETGKDRFREFSEMSNFLLNDRIQFDEKTGAITEPLAC